MGWGNKVGPGKLDLQLQMNYLLSYKNRTLNNFPTNEFVGTLPYFGVALGQAFPRIKGNVTGRYTWGDFSFDARWRYIDAMKNRMAVIFPGENFTGVPAVTYLDLGAGYRFGKYITLRVGISNVLDKKPPTYSPNVQSGTDPSTYDVVGRRLMAQLALKF